MHTLHIHNTIASFVYTTTHNHKLNKIGKEKKIMLVGKCLTFHMITRENIKGEFMFAAAIILIRHTRRNIE